MNIRTTVLTLALTAITLTATAEVRIAPHLNNVSTTGVTFSWETTEPAAGMVELSSLYGGHPITAAKTDPEKINLLRVEGLEPDTEYSYTLTTDGQTFTNSFKTAPAEPRPISFCVIGDSRRWGTTVADTGMIDHMLQWNPEFFLINGDLVFDGHVHEQWPEHFDRFGSLVGKYMVASARGNHEGSILKDVENDWFGKMHELPGEGEPYSAFTWGNTHIILLSWEQTVFPHLQPQCAEWLDSHLATVDTQYKIICQHFPIYCTGYYSADDERKEDSENMRYQRDVMDKYDLDAHFSGHTHIYERHYPLRNQKRDDENGILYVVNGGDIGGNFPDWWTAVGDDPSQYTEPTYSSVLCEEGYMEVRAFAWHREQKEFHQLDHVIRYEDESLPKGILDSLASLSGDELTDTIERLGAMIYAPAASKLLPYLESDDQEVRRAAATAIRAIGNTDVSSDLIAHLKDDDPHVRQELSRAIEIAATQDAAAQTIDHIFDTEQDDRTRINLIGALQFHAKPDVASEALFKLLAKDGEPARVQERAAYALTRVVTDDDIDTMIDMFENGNSKYVMVRLAHALTELTGERVSTNPNSRVYEADPGKDRERYTKRWRDRESD